MDLEKCSELCSVSLKTLNICYGGKLIAVNLHIFPREICCKLWTDSHKKWYLLMNNVLLLVNLFIKMFVSDIRCLPGKPVPTP